MKIKRKNSKAFTLVELVMVIVILGILAAIVIPAFTGLSAQARATAEDATIASVQKGISIYDAEQQVR